MVLLNSSQFLLQDTDSSSSKIGWSKNSWPFLVSGLVFVGLACFLWYLSYRFSHNKPSQETLARYGWFSRWIIKNRLILIMIGAAFCSIIAVCFILQTFGIIVPMQNNLE
ncbi:MAG: hypothetical protein LBG49_00675 [Mycoplasmataceae bacterium]|jgi:ABC-type Fe3+ transport system permease subunit|nr:hypothetical protein [Mycoplasmataceae bacterium]